MSRIKKIGVLSLAKFYTLFMAVMGLILGILVTVLNKFVASAEIPQISATGYLTAIILFPIIYGIMGFVMGLLLAWIYNLVAKLIGGIEIELDKK